MKQQRLIEALEKKSVLVLDGAFGTELERHGCDIHDPLWSSKVLIDNPEMIKKVHVSYLVAGADLIESAGYQATITGFERHGFSRDEAIALVKESLRISLAARAEFEKAVSAGQSELYGITLPKEVRESYVVASMGPYGAFLADGSEYRGDYGVTQKVLESFHEERLHLLLEEGPDAIAFETVPSLLEAKAIVSVLQRVPQELRVPTWISFSCQDGSKISNGEPIAEVAALLDGEDVVQGIGINCTAPEYVESLVTILRSHTNKLIVVYPNLGETYDGLTKTWQGNPSLFLDNVKAWIEAGANIVGGCCRTSPDTIQAVRKIVDGIRGR